MDIFRKLFGLDRDDDQQHRQYTKRNEFFKDSDHTDDSFPRRGFDIFTDPLQMHQYFEQEMNEMLKRFGFQEFGQFSIFDSPNMPALDSSPPLEGEGKSQDLRDQFLKPGFVKPQSHSEMVDKDIDDKVKSGDFDSLLEEKHDNQVIPYKPPTAKSYFKSHGTMQSIKSISKPDGTIETHRTVKDSQGNEETTVCHKIGNKEYCVINKKDGQGNIVRSEQFVNMTEDEKDIFLKPSITNPIITEKDPKPEFPWDKFFK